MVTREEAKAAANQLADLTVPLNSERLRLARIVRDYLNQEPENSDADVWADILELLKPTKLAVWGVADGEWGILDVASMDCVTDAYYSPKDILKQLREMVNPEPTLETVQAARKAAENKLWAQDVILKGARVACEMAEEKLEAAEVEMGKWKATSRKLARDTLTAVEKLAVAEEKIAGIEAFFKAHGWGG